MKRDSTRWVVGILFGLTLGMATFALVGAAPENKSLSSGKWEYKTVTATTKSLESELNKLGKSGWKLVSVVRDDLLFDQDSEGNSHIRVVRVRIIATRRRVK